MIPANINVLVVDDMKTMRLLVKAQLSQLGLKNTIEANSGNAGFAALTAAKAEKPVSLILSDWNMPDGTGIDFLKKVRGTPDFQGLPFVLITAEGELSQVQEAIQLGVSNYLVKPFNPASFKEKVESAWKKHL